MASDLDDAISELSEKGYEFVSITPVTSGAYNYDYKSSGVSSSKRIISGTEKVSGGGSYGYGYGYSYTEGFMLLMKKT